MNTLCERPAAPASESPNDGAARSTVWTCVVPWLALIAALLLTNGA